jgi:hypothetical protein
MTGDEGSALDTLLFVEPSGDKIVLPAGHHPNTKDRGIVDIEDY